MNAIGLYDTMVMGYRVKVQPYKISIFDEDGSIESSQIPNKLVKWLSDEIVKTKEYQKKAWSDVTLISKGE